MKGRRANVLWTLLAVVCCAGVARCDSGCVERFGTCKSTSEGCSGGSFTSGLCNGPASRQCCVPSASRSGSCSSVTLVSRAGWDARVTKPPSYMHTPVSLVFIHHTAGSACSTSAVCARVALATQAYHMQFRGYSDIGYNFLVGGDGKIYEGRGWDSVGAHTVGYNSRSIAISFMGNFTSQSPTTAAVNAAQNLIECGVSIGKISTAYELYGHRQGGSTSCPGDRLYSIIQSWPHWTSGRAPPIMWAD